MSQNLADRSLSGKTIVITGGTLGIGLSAALELRRAGAQVVITGRSEKSATQAVSLGCQFIRADYARLADVRKLAATLLEKYPRIDVLANNVGGVMNERRVTEDGHELTFQVNHLAGFLLTHLLRERLERSQAVVINTSSSAHARGRVDLGDLEGVKSYGALSAYANVKLMNILHARELNRRHSGVSTVSFHPGVVATGFARAGGALVRFVYSNPLKNLFMISPERGADTLVWLAGSKPGSDWTPGEYYVKRRLARTRPEARDPELARGLWDASLAMV